MSDEILVVDPEGAVRELLSSHLGLLGHKCTAAATAEEALRIWRDLPGLSLVISDVNLGGTSGVDLIRLIRAVDESVQVVMLSGLDDLGTIRKCLQEGAYDFLRKPFEIDSLTNTVNRAIERSRLLREVDNYRRNLEKMVDEQTDELRETRDIAMLTLAKLAESRDSHTGVHLERMAAFSRRLAEELRRESPYKDLASDSFIEQISKSSPLHDIGKVGVPDQILLKPGPLTTDEFTIMKRHTTIGGDTLSSVIQRFEKHTFLLMGMEIAYSHHERWDGSGYPAGISGDQIPLAPRIVAVADAYDTITSARPYKRAFGHQEAVRRLVIDKEKHFDPLIVDAFLACEADIASIHGRFALGRKTDEPRPA